MVIRLQSVLILGIGLLTAFVAPPGGQAEAPTEYQVKAAFLYNFAKFVEWPADTFKEAPSPFVIGVIGNDPFGSDLSDELMDKTVQGHSLKLKHIDSLQEIADCQVLFIGKSETVRLAVILDAARNHPVLTVGDSPHFIQKGGMLGLVLEHSRIRFNVNAGAAANARLKLSSDLLKLARTIKS